MRRNISDLKDSEYDMVILGGGVQGLYLSLESASRGLKTLLLDEYDFCSQTSANSLKILHGGFRYLQHFNVRRYYQSAREGAVLQTIAPQWIQEMPFYFPLTQKGLRSPFFVSLAFNIHRLALACLNAGFKQAPHIESITTQFEGLEHALHGGKKCGVFYDRFLEDSELYLMALVRSAREMGVVLLNHVSVETCVRSENKLKEIILWDKVFKSRKTIFGKFYVTSLGVSTDAFFATHFKNANAPLFKPLCVYNLIIKRPLFESKGAHIVFSKPDADYPKGRGLVFIPWKEGTLIGTFEKEVESYPVAPLVHENHLRQFLEFLKAQFSVNLQEEDVVACHTGFVPAGHETESSSMAEDTPNICDMQPSLGVDNCLSVVPVKLTMARFMSVNTLNKVYQKTGQGKKCGVFEKRYLLHTQEQIVGLENLALHVNHAVHHEQAVYPEDVLLRRTQKQTVLPFSKDIWQNTLTELKKYFPPEIYATSDYHDLLHLYYPFSLKKDGG